MFKLLPTYTLAGSIALTELFTKIMLYYFHERIWAASSKIARAGH
jgi:uncharacterized membrane protein